MPRILKGSQPPTPRGKRYGKRGRPRKVEAVAEFGWDPPAEVVDGAVPPMQLAGFSGDQPSEPAPELVAIGLPPDDAAGIQKWHYRVLSTMAALALRDNTISNETRMKRVAALTLAAARHYPEAAKYDLAQQISRDAEAVAGRKRAKAAAKLEKAPAAGGAKVIPIRRDAQGS